MTKISGRGRTEVGWRCNRSEAVEEKVEEKEVKWKKEAFNQSVAREIPSLKNR